MFSAQAPAIGTWRATRSSGRGRWSTSTTSGWARSNWHGEVPAGINDVFRATTNTGFIAPRSFMDDTTNWLPAPAGKDFSLYLRACWPKVAGTDGSWTPPAVQLAT